jgi:outer membrane protein assembly factor BamB
LNKPLFCLICLGALTLAACTSVAKTGPGFQNHWPQWRGPFATGEAPLADPPLEWSEDRNIRWKVAVPGRGHASPIIWGDQVFVLAAVPDGQAPPAAEPESEPKGDRRRGIKPQLPQKFTVFSFDRKDGHIRWQKVLRSELPHEGTHNDGTWASNSAVTDGEHLYAYFGSRGLYCLNLDDGQLIWEKDLGDMATRNGFGEGSSPVIHNDTIVLLWDHEGPSFIVALDKRSGQEKWRVERDERTSWSTPLVVEIDGRAQVITSATRVRSYDLETGDLVWQDDGMTANVVPSPVYADGLVYVASGFRGNALHAIRLHQAKGDITGSPAIAWQYERDTPYVPSLLLYGDLLYFFKSNDSILSCLNAKTGEVLYGPQRLDGVKGIYASPVGAADRVYVAGRNGATMVVKHGPSFEMLATNLLDDSFDASPAIVDRELYLRGQQHLYCIAAP